MAEAPSPDLGAPEEAYRVLARKYRPSDFTGLIGQEALVRTLSNAFATGRIAHAFMLTGVRGVGKTTTARIIARALNCIGPDGKRTEPTIHPCGVCDPCVTIAESRNVDVQEMDAASQQRHRRSARDHRGGALCPGLGALQGLYHRRSAYAVQAGLQRPAEDAGRAAAACEIHLRHHRNPQSAGDGAVALPALRSAPHRSRGELAAYLGQIAAKENVEIEEGALALIARAAEGSARDALSLLDQAIAHDEDGRDHGRDRCATCWAWPIAAGCWICSKK